MIRNDLVCENDFENMNLREIDERFYILTIQLFWVILIMMDLHYFLKMLRS